MKEQFSNPSKEVLAIVKKIRRKYYPEFVNAKIITLMRNGKWGKWGTIRAVSAEQRKAGIAADYILTLKAAAWENFSKKQKRALVDHELAHMVCKETKKGIKFRCRHHDVEEFSAIVKRYGAWSPGLVKFKKSFKGEE